MKSLLLKLILGMVGIFVLFPLTGYGAPVSESKSDNHSSQLNVEKTTNYQGMNRFALALYRNLTKLDWSGSKGNFVFSPYSLSMALGMCQRGAGGRTLEEMTSVLGLPADKDQAAKLYSDILRDLENHQGVAFRTANAIWWDKRFSIIPEYQKKIEGAFLARLKSADFSGAESRERERLEINDFVEERTLQRIKKLLPPGSLSPDAVCVLVNAVHFLGDWKTKFNPAMTKDAKFNLDDGFMSVGKQHLGASKNSVLLPIMSEAKMPARFSLVEGWRAVELPFRGGQLSFVALLPEGESLSSREEGKGLEERAWASLMSEFKLQTEGMRVNLPKFRLEATLKSTDTKAILLKMGMPSIFDSADFTHMCGKEPIFISDIFHKSFIEVNEAGAEAAAATAVVMDRGLSSHHEPLPIFVADRPFVFAIRHVNSGAILFMGRMADPR